MRKQGLGRSEGVHSLYSFSLSFCRPDNDVLDANRHVDRVERRTGNRKRDLEDDDLHSQFHLNKSQRRRCTIEVAEIMAGHGALPPSLARIEPRSEKTLSGSPKAQCSEGDDTLFQLNKRIDVEKEVTQFVEELDEYEGKEELVFTFKTRKSPSAGNANNWGGDVSAPEASIKYDNVSLPQKTSHITEQKNGIPVSVLASHFERKESRYPSFIGARNSVGMTGTTTAGSFRTLQRNSIRRASMEVTYPALSPQVVEVIRSLEEHRKKAEEAGNYMEARAAAQRLNGVKILEDNKRKAAMIKRHSQERGESGRLYEKEMEGINRIWDEKLHEFHKSVVQHAATLKREQLSALQLFRQRSAAKAPIKPQWSPALLKHRKVQTFLGKQGKYLEADEVKRIADNMELLELRATRAAYAAEAALKEQALRAKQQNEMEVLLQRAAQGRDELRKQRDMEHARSTQRFHNVKRELWGIQKQENAKVEQILGKRIDEFQRSGGSLLMLSDTLSGVDSLTLPGNQS